MPVSPKHFARQMLNFYQLHGRKDLPWQQNPSAYRVWVSEVMLQQTQVRTVIPYYQNFMLRFPDVRTLAEANIDEVLVHWQGLGYYSRARNLHRCAQTLIEEYTGEFPDNMAQMQSLPGIGRSTAGAILSLAMAKSTPILDGNVKRVLSRVFLVDGWYGQAAVAKKLWQLSEDYTPKEQSGEFNQAMMDLGASLCRRSQPLCQQCPLAKSCQAHLQRKTDEYPQRKPKKTLPIRETSFILQQDQDKVQLLKRPPSGIWGGLWSLPEQAGEEAEVELITRFRHTFTHFHLHISIVTGAVNTTAANQIKDNHTLAWHNIRDLPRLALPTPFRKFLFQHFDLNEQLPR